ncbi:ribonuclease H-like domain-containing protein [Edaphobacillus lindanitolerans]|uniref:YprB ribonuclease H-like domain-containing protein n=1 Tax=Edaphobacillus lindanitolerans TaxID=550447 RepID=A0A1U7PL71_9BACI|nr:ribonuclease H-like domain-containing protein [Edaphobacillus lindanitolerans]SIT66249.1 hypothetical protein SAMN05428946_0044 [Edaphobacillus lindanitolerans]
MSYENKLMQMKKMLKKKAPETQARETAFQKPDAPEYAGRWQEAGLERIDNQFGTVFLRTVRYSPETVHGTSPLGELEEAAGVWAGSDGIHPFAEGDVRRLLFFDTETTGLKGTGSLIFMAGLLSVRDGEFVLDQYVLAGPAHETAFLYETGLWKPGFTVVTYNGKSFDWPQLKTRWTMCREHLPKLGDPDHIDLLQGTRRIWKGGLKSFSLKSIEEEILGFRREDDIPGFLAPIIYTDAVKSGSPDLLLGVLRHNEWDLLSLVTLFVRLTSLLMKGNEEPTPLPHTNIGKWFGDLKAYGRSREVLEEVTDLFFDETDEAHYHLGFLLKREGRYPDAEEAFEHAFSGKLDESMSLKALEEIAKLNEHRLGNLVKAEINCLRAIGLLEGMDRLKPKQKQRWKAAFEKRLSRIRSKREKQSGS